MEYVNLEKCSKNFGNQQVLKEISYSFFAGGYCISGENGSGKSTLLKMMMGLILPDTGCVTVIGGKSENLSPSVKAQIGYMFSSDRTLYYKLTARENLEMIGSIYGLKGNHLKDRVSKVLQLVELEDNKKYIIRAVKSDSNDISLYYRMYKSFIKLGNVEVYGRYKNLNMRINGLMIGSLDDSDVIDYISLKYLSTSTFIGRLYHLKSTSDIFELCAGYTLVYDTDIHLIEGTAYTVYPTYKIFDYHGYKDMVDTKDAIRNFNTNFSKGGCLSELANEVGYDENNPVTEENFGERLIDIFNMEYKCYEILGQEYGFDFECITLDLSGEEPLKRKE